MSDCMWPQGLQLIKPPFSLPSPRVYPNSRPLQQWCHPAISPSDALFFFPQSFPASGTFPVSQLFTSGDQNTGASATASVFPMSIQGQFCLVLTGLISSLSKGLSGVLLSTTVGRHQFFGSLHSLWSSSQPYMTTAKTIALTILFGLLSAEWYLLFNILYRFVITFLQRSNHLISWLQSPSTVILEPKKRKSVTASTFSHSFCMK